MFYKRLLVFIFFCTSTVAFCQYEIPKEYAWTPLLLDFNGGRDFGSGVLYKDSTAVYLITAKHVIQKYIDRRDSSNLENVMLITLYTKNINEIDSIKKEKMELKLNRIYKDNMLLMHPTKDIAIVRIAYTKNNGFFVYKDLVWYEDKASIPLVYKAANIGYFKDVITTRDVFVFGYPKTIGLEKQPQYDFNAPLIQKGIISAKDYARKSFILNCPVYGGNSGGPVIQVTINNIRLIGIVTEYIPFINKENAIEFNSGYSVVTPIEFAIELINKFN